MHCDECIIKMQCEATNDIVDLFDEKDAGWLAAGGRVLESLEADLEMEKLVLPKPEEQSNKLELMYEALDKWNDFIETASIKTESTYNAFNQKCGFCSVFRQYNIDKQCSQCPLYNTKHRSIRVCDNSDSNMVREAIENGRLGCYDAAIEYGALVFYHIWAAIKEQEAKEC